jgi:hypothetical protein
VRVGGAGMHARACFNSGCMGFSSAVVASAIAGKFLTAPQSSTSFATGTIMATPGLSSRSCVLRAAHAKSVAENR